MNILYEQDMQSLKEIFFSRITPWQHSDLDTDYK